MSNITRGQRRMLFPLRVGTLHEPRLSLYSRAKLTQLYAWAITGEYVPLDDLFRPKRVRWDQVAFEKWADDFVKSKSAETSVVAKHHAPIKGLGGEE